MKKFLLLSCVTLVSCAGPLELDPEEVLRRSSIAHRDLAAADVLIDATITTGNAEQITATRVEANGRLAKGGGQSAFSVHLDSQQTLDARTQGISADLEVIVAGEGDAYFFIRSLESVPPHELFSSAPFTQFLNAWIHLPATDEAAIDLTPDPALLQMQTDIVRVSADKGIEVLNGRAMRRLDVTLDQARLNEFFQTLASADTPGDMTYAGTLWIDAKTYVLRRAEWQIHSLDSDSLMDARLTAEITPRDEIRAISPPANAVELPFLRPGMGLDGLLFPQSGLMDDAASQ